MYAQVAKLKERKSRMVTDSVAQKKKNGKQGFGLVDKNPKRIRCRTKDHNLASQLTANATGYTMQLVKKKINNRMTPLTTIEDINNNLPQGVASISIQNVIDYIRNNRNELGLSEDSEYNLINAEVVKHVIQKYAGDDDAIEITQATTRDDIINDLARDTAAFVDERVHLTPIGGVFNYLGETYVKYTEELFSYLKDDLAGSTDGNINQAINDLADTMKNNVGLKPNNGTAYGNLTQAQQNAIDRLETGNHVTAGQGTGGNSCSIFTIGNDIVAIGGHDGTSRDYKFQKKNLDNLISKVKF